MSGSNDELERRILELEGKVLAMEHALVAVVRPALEAAGGLSADSWQLALRATASTVRGILLGTGYPLDQANAAVASIEALADAAEAKDGLRIVK